MDKRQRRFIEIALSLVIAISFWSGYGLKGVLGENARRVQFASMVNGTATGHLAFNSVSFKPIETLWNVLAQVRSQYVKKNLDERQLTYGAIRGMLKALGDPYTRFMDPKEYQDFQTETSGELEGVGAQLGMKGDKLIVIAPIKGSPADKAGVKALDFIVKIDGKSTDGMSTDEAVSLIRGKRATSVVLTVERQGVPHPLDIPILRDRIEVPSVEYSMLEDRIARIWIKTFNEKTEEELDKALKDLQDKKMRALILDLRNDPGGVLTTAVNVASHFVKGPIVHVEGRDNKRESLNAIAGKLIEPPLPMVVLVNEASASASEIVAGALQDNNAAFLIGARTFGKGLVQTVLPLSGNGGALVLTTQKYFTPKFRDINLKGIEPDQVVNPLQWQNTQTPAEHRKVLAQVWMKRGRDHLDADQLEDAYWSFKRAADLLPNSEEPKEGLLKVEERRQQLQEKDVQLDKALEHLRATLVQSRPRGGSKNS